MKRVPVVTKKEAVAIVRGAIEEGVGSPLVPVRIAVLDEGPRELCGHGLSQLRVQTTCSAAIRSTCSSVSVPTWSTNGRVRRFQRAREPGSTRSNAPVATVHGGSSGAQTPS